MLVYATGDSADLAAVEPDAGFRALQRQRYSTHAAEHDVSGATRPGQPTAAGGQDAALRARGEASGYA